MDSVTTTLIEKTAAYIEATQPIIDAQNERRRLFVERATKAAHVLAEHGVLDARRVDAFVDKVASDPCEVWSVVEKLTRAVSPDSLGKSASVKVGSGTYVDPFERAFFGVGSGNSGMVE